MYSPLSRQSSTTLQAIRRPLQQKDPKSAVSVDELPVEILGAIFLEVVTNPARGSTPHLEQNTILSVSRRWRDVILNTPGAWRHFWIRPSLLPSSVRAGVAAGATSPGPPEHAKGWLGLEKAKRRLGRATLNLDADLPISITVDLSSAEFQPNLRNNLDSIALRWKTVQLICNQVVMDVWKSGEVHDPPPALFAKDLVQLASTIPLSRCLEELSEGYPGEQKFYGRK